MQREPAILATHAHLPTKAVSQLSPSSFRSSFPISPFLGFFSDPPFEGGLAMAEPKEGPSVVDEVAEKPRAGSSSSSYSGSGEPSAVKSAVRRLFGRQKPVHSVLGGGMPADVLLWRNKKLSGGVLGVATAVWVLFELIEYHLLTLVCHCAILALAGLFVWSKALSFINKSPPSIPEVVVPEDATVKTALALRFEVNRALFVLREIALGRDLKKFLAVIAGLWFFSIVGSWCNFLTFVYIAFILLHTVPVLYEKYEDRVDPLAEKALTELKKQYAAFDAKVLSKIPKGPLKSKKTE